MSDSSVCDVSARKVQNGVQFWAEKGTAFFSTKLGATLVGTPHTTQLTASCIPSPEREVVRADNVLCLQCSWN